MVQLLVLVLSQDSFLPLPFLPQYKDLNMNASKLSLERLKIKLGDDITHCKNVRGLGKSMVVFGLFEKLRYSNERSTKFESLKQE